MIQRGGCADGDRLEGCSILGNAASSWCDCLFNNAKFTLSVVFFLFVTITYKNNGGELLVICLSEQMLPVGVLALVIGLAVGYCDQPAVLHYFSKRNNLSHGEHPDIIRIVFLCLFPGVEARRRVGDESGG